MEAANEELPTNTVVYMGDFLIRKHIELQKRRITCTRMPSAFRRRVSPKRMTRFAAPLYTKAAKMDEELGAIARHIRFIMRGGRGQSIPTHGYSLQHRRARPQSRPRSPLRGPSQPNDYN